MLHYLYHTELHAYPKLYESMFKDRADQFKRRLQWAVQVDEQGYEQDDYDQLNPLYAIWVLPDGRHGGSMRTLPTTGPVMVNDHFKEVIGHEISAPNIWESTRFCLAPDLRDRAFRISAAIMLAGCEIGLQFNLEKAVAIFDPRMVRIYRTLGWPPQVLGSIGTGRDRICAGTWQFSETTRRNMAKRAGVSPELSRLWIRRAFDNKSDAAA
ncbi:acyl-homoserine-lactone synthase [Amylibacter marinus]|uniref:Acyl-homoserine-lactone synthase n=1 Tax=Amylibacter marinus TaxID=1475483 RepID=A0ABQ5VTL9_9RHOB|nr:acyl-homoserine-lactone synthase [Amylibacter marinus]GLQ34499.1 acyl-homoserine-lactone synthase [Amylibacter marinus]